MFIMIKENVLEHHIYIYVCCEICFPLVKIDYGL